MIKKKAMPCLILVFYFFTGIFFEHDSMAQKKFGKKPPRHMIIELENVIGEKAFKGCNVSDVTRLQIEAIEAYQNADAAKGEQLLKKAMDLAHNLEPIDLRLMRGKVKLHSAKQEASEYLLLFEKSPFGFIQGEIGQNDDGESFLTDLGVYWNKPYGGAFNIVQKLGKNVYQLDLEKDVDFQKMDMLVKDLVLRKKINCVFPLPPFAKLLSASDDVIKQKTGRVHNKSFVMLTPDQYEKISSYIIERYDGDGFNDMPGSPVLKYWSVGIPEVERKPWKDSVQMARLVKAGYDAVKKQNPSFQAVLAGSGFFKRSWGKDGIYRDIVNRLSGDMRCPDLIFDYHFWSPPKQHRQQAQALLLVKEVLGKAGYKNNEIWTTDGGSYDDYQTRKMDAPATEKEHAADVIRRYIVLLSHGQAKLFWTRILEFDWTKTDTNMYDFTGLVNNPKNLDGKDWKKLSYFTYKLMVEKLTGVDWEKNITTDKNLDPPFYGYQLVKKNGDGFINVLWWEYWNDPSFRQGDTKEISLHELGIKTKAKVVESVASAENGRIIEDEGIFYDALFNTYITYDKIQLGQHPVFIEWAPKIEN